MTQKEITQLSYEIVGCAITVNKTLGPGLLEGIYEKCLKYELEKNGFHVAQQVPVPIVYDEMTMESILQLDLLVDDLVVVELKAVNKVLPVHEAQLMTYMNLLQKPLGLLINFYTTNITNSYKSIVNQHFRAFDLS